MSMSEKIFGSFIVVVATATVATFALVTPFTGFYPTYSEGERVGVVTKLSEKGVIVKSIEGTMTLSGASGGVDSSGLVMGNQFHFSVRPDSKVAVQLHDAMNSGKSVVVKYNQWWVKPKVMIDTEYEINSVTYTTDIK